MRRALVKVHLWFGLTLGLLWTVQGLGGALLVFHREAQRVESPTGASGRHASLDLLFKRAEEAAGNPIRRLGIASERGDIVWAEYTDRTGSAQKIPIDAYRAKAINADPFSPFGSTAVWSWLYRFHDSLAAGKAGERLVGASGLLLLIATSVGLWIAWPRGGRWRGIFRFQQWKNSNQRLYGYHRAIGFVMSAVALVTVPCGVYIALSHDLRPLMALVLPFEPSYRPDAGSAVPEMSISPQRALQKAQEHYPGAAFVSFSMPSAEMPAYVIRLRQPDEYRLWSGTTSVVIDPSSGNTLHLYDPINAPLGNRLADAAFSVHNGEIGGVVGRIVVLLTGLAIPTLFGLGAALWWRRRRRRVKPG